MADRAHPYAQREDAVEALGEGRPPQALPASVVADAIFAAGAPGVIQQTLQATTNNAASAPGANVVNAATAPGAGTLNAAGALGPNDVDGLPLVWPTYVSSGNMIGSWKWTPDQGEWISCGYCTANFSVSYNILGVAPQALHVGNQVRRWERSGQSGRCPDCGTYWREVRFAGSASSLPHHRVLP